MSLRGAGAWLLLAALAGAAAVRFYGLDNASLLPDECFSYRLAQYPVPEIAQRTALDVHPPLYYVLLKGWFGLWGPSPWTLRALGALWSIGAVAALYLLCVEAFRATRAEAPGLTEIAAGFAALLCAFHLAQVVPGRFGRMYSLGVFLACASAWLLLRAWRAERGRVGWWSAYGITLAALLYTHYYALFTVAAQVLFVAGTHTVQWRRMSWAAVRPPLLGFAYAGLLAVILYAPWLPVLLAQLRTVHDSFWIPPLEWVETSRIFFCWSTGLEGPHPRHADGWIVVFLVLVGATLWRGDRSGWFLLLQALLPWVLALGFSLLTGRPMLMERYLAFAQVFLLGYWGWVWLRLPGILERAVFTCIVGAAALAGLGEALLRWPRERPAIAMAAAYVQERRQTGDLVVAPYPIALNCFRCYLDHAGAPDLELRTLRSSFEGSPLMSHAYALSAKDVMDEGWLAHPSVRRIWLVHDGGPTRISPAPDMEKILERTFADPRRSSYSVSLFVRKE